jgi:hypothetical protein
MEPAQSSTGMDFLHIRRDKMAETGEGEQRRVRDQIEPTPMQFKLDGTRMMLALQEAGVDIKKLDVNYLLERGGHDFEIKELQSRLETARLRDWEVIVTVGVNY